MRHDRSCKNSWPGRYCFVYKDGDQYYRGWLIGIKGYEGLHYRKITQETYDSFPADGECHECMK